MRLNFNWFVRVQFLDVDQTSRFLEFLLEFFSDRNNVAVFDNLLGELIEEFLFGKRVEAVQV